MSRASLSGLSYDIVCLIAEYVCESSPASIDSLLKINSAFRSAAKPLSHRHKSISLRPSRVEANDGLEGWLGNKDLLRGLRTLTLDGRLTRQRSQLNTPWSRLATVIQRLAKFEILCWGCAEPVPAVVICALEEHQPNAELRVQNWTRRHHDADHTDIDEIALAQSPALTRISTSAGVFSPDLKVPAFHRIVALAPNLTEVSLSFDSGRSGPMRRPQRQNEYEEIERKKAEFYSYVQPNMSVKKLLLHGTTLSRRSMDTWENLVDLSRIEHLEAGGADEYFYEHAPQKLPNIKHLALRYPHPIDRFGETRRAGQEYLERGCGPLEGLSLSHWDEILPLRRILDRHGPTLRILELHKHERASAVREEPLTTLSVDELKEIKTKCPHLQELSIDKNPNTANLEINDQTEEMLHILSGMKLDRLHLWDDIGISSALARHFALKISMRVTAGEKPDADPLQLLHIEPYIEEIWKRLFAGRTTGQRALDIEFSAWKDPSTPRRGLYTAFRLSWQARPQERDDLSQECRVAEVKR